MPIVALLFFGVTQSSVNLRFQPAVGATYRYSMHLTLNNPMGGGPIDTRCVIGMHIVSAEKGKFKVEIRYSQVKVNTPRGAAAARDIEAGVAAQSFVRTVDTRWRSPEGSVFGGSFDVPTLADHAVKVGERWSAPVHSTGAIGKLLTDKGFGSKLTGSAKEDNMLSKLAGKVATVNTTLSGVLHLAVSTGGAGAPMKVNLKVSGGGETKFDSRTGLMLASSSKSVIEIGLGGQGVKVTNSCELKKL